MFISIYNWLCKKIGVVREEATPKNDYILSATPRTDNVQDTDKAQSFLLEEAQLTKMMDETNELENSILGKRKTISRDVEPKCLLTSGLDVDDDSIVKSPAIVKKVKTENDCIECGCTSTEKEKSENVSTEKGLYEEKSPDFYVIQDKPSELQYYETNSNRNQEDIIFISNDTSEGSDITKNQKANAEDKNIIQEDQECTVQSQKNTENEIKTIDQAIGQRKLDSEEILQRSALKKQRKLSAQKTNSKIQTPQKFEQKIILKIFDGEIIYPGKPITKCSFYTCETYLDIIMFPALKQPLIITGQVIPAELLKFLEKLHQRSTVLEDKKALFGWISAKDDDEKGRLQAIAEQIKIKNKCNVIHYLNSMLIYILSPSMLNEELQKKLNWIPKSPHGGPEIGAILLFAIYLKKTLEEKVQHIEPEFVGISLEPSK